MPDIARENRDFIINKLDEYEQLLHPSSSEDEELIRRAVFAVRNKSILFESYIPFSMTLYTKVQDVRAAEIVINFRKASISCTCSKKGTCRHQVAVLLALFQYFGSVQDWSSNWRAKKSVQLHTLAEERSPESWQRMVDEVLGHILHDDRRIEGFLVPSLAETARTKLRRHMPFEREWQPLFKLYTELAILDRIWTHLIHTNSPIQSDYFEYYAARSFETIKDYMEELQSGPRLFATDPFYVAIQQSVRALLVIEQGVPQLRLAAYLNFWLRLFTSPAQISEELAALHDLSATTTDINIDVVKTAFTILQKDEQAFHDCLQLVNAASIDTFIAISKFAMELDATIYTEQILKALIPYLPDFIQHHLSPMQRQQMTWVLDDLYSNLMLSEDEELQLYSAYGKYGVQPFSDYLIKNERYSDWAALHQLYPSSIAYLDRCGLKTVLANAPETTLPLYHHYAMEEIRQKSRLNYKQAVRIWRTMKSAAKKAGKMTFWEDYIQTIRLQYKRLRALQEEIDKSNLLV